MFSKQDPTGSKASHDTGVEVLRDPLLSKGPVFSLEERDALRLRGLIPPTPLSMEQLVTLELEHIRAKHDDLERFC
jgi:malate dehydrogenase (oxaloacetate-decarboxylating)(NADP+)